MYGFYCMYVRIGILARSAENIFIYFDVVFTYYSKEDGRLQRPHDIVASPATTETLPSKARSLN